MKTFSFTVITFIILTFMISTDKPFFTNESWEERWAIVDSLENILKFESALNATEELLQKAFEEKDRVNYLRAVDYKSSYIMALNPGDLDKAIEFVKGEKERTGEIISSVLSAQLGTMYLRFFERNRARISLRTDADIDESKGVEALTEADFLRIAEKYFLQSLESELTKEVTNISLERITGGDSIGHILRPYLYQTLLHQTLDFYSKATSWSSEVGPQFLLRDEEFYGSGEDFMALSLNKKGVPEGSYLYKSLKLYQQALGFAQESGNRMGFGDLDLLRLKFVHSVFSSQQKDTYFRNALIRGIEEYSDDDVQLAFGFEVVQDLNRRGADYSYQEGDPNKWLRRDAVELAGKLLKDKPNSHWAPALKSIKDQITAPVINYNMEAAIIPGRDFLLSLDCKNMPSIKASIFSISRQDQLDWRQTNAMSLYKTLADREVYKEIVFDIPDVGDFHEHRIELPFEKIDKKGLYLMVVMPKEGIGSNNYEYMRWHYFQVSDLIGKSVNYRWNLDGLFVLNRTNGSPIEGAQVTVSEESYDRRQRILTDNKLATKLTDKNGFAAIEPLNLDFRSNATVKIKTDNDSLYIDSSFRSLAGSSANNRDPHSSRSVNERSFFYTDRSIYRPGQIVYFKGLLSESRDRISSEPVQNRKVSIQLRSPNQRLRQVVELTTNEYGAFNGHFVLPEGLTGRYQLSINGVRQGSISFNVEEYKRPSFYVEMEGAEGEYSFGDSIDVKGVARAYSGFTVQNARVSYRIYRRISFPFPRQRGLWFFPPIQPNEIQIASGETTTSSEGEFLIGFMAEVEEDFQSCRRCVYSYSINVDVLDAAGELQSSNYNLSISADPLMVEVNLPDRLDLSKTSSINVKSVNPDGKPLDALLDIRIVKLIPPDFNWLDRKWNHPTQFYLKEEEFRSRFTHHPYDRETSVENWSEGEVVLKKQFSISGEKSVPIPKGMTAGTYRIQIKNAQKEGDILLYLNNFDAIHSEKAEFSNREALEVLLNKDGFKAGDLAELRVGSRFENLKVIVLLENPDGSMDFKWLNTDGANKFSKPIEEKDYGGLNLHLGAVVNGHFVSQRVFFNVPFDHKKFTIKSIDIPEMVEPGSDQKWKFQLLDHKGEPASGSILASMYDQSLDAILPHNWQINLFNNRGSTYSLTSHTHSASRSRGHSPRIHFNTTTIHYPNLFSRFLQSRYYLRRGQMTAHSPVVVEYSVPLIEQDSETITAAQVRNVPLSAELAEEGIVGKTEDSAEDAFQQIRENLNETVFFFPDITTDENGYFYLDFEMNEAMTNWKLQLLALDSDFRHAIATYEVQTSSDLIVLPNWPRFFMQRDRIYLPVRLINNADVADVGTLDIRIVDPITGEDWTIQFTDKSQMDFSFEAEGSEVSFFKLNVPSNAPALLEFSVRGRTSSGSDGERKLIHILSSNIWITESFPFFLKNGEILERTLRLNNGIEGGLRSTVFEYTADPLFLAIQSMPVAANRNARNSLAHFRNYYQTRMALHRVEENPVIKDYIKSWIANNKPTAELLRNEDLRDIPIELTPWNNQALQQQQTIDNLQLLLNTNQIRHQLNASMNELKKLQNRDGGFSWFAGDRSNFFITTQILSGIGNLHRSGIQYQVPDMGTLIRNSLNYLDESARDQYNRFYRDKDRTISSTLVAYLHVKTVLEPWAADFEEWDELLKLAKRDWAKLGNMQQATLGIIFHILEEDELAQLIVESLLERTRYERGKGRFIPASERWQWYSNSLLIHGRFIELLQAVGGLEKEIAEVQEYLMHHRRVNGWPNTGATVETISALFAGRGEINPITEVDDIQVNGIRLPKSMDDITPGSGYFRTDIDNAPNQMDLKIKHTTENISWGTVYHQYFEDIRKVDAERSDEQPISLEREWMLEEVTETGSVLRKLREGEVLEVGQKLVSRIILKVDRPMEFIQIRDLRPSALEPGNELSGYRFSDGLQYYYAPGDSQTDFFFDRIRTGTYVLEYSTHIAYAGNFPSGLIKAQSYFAPEFVVYGNSGGELEVR